MNLNTTPKANRIHIGFFGKRNSGKSSLINAFTGQEVTIVSDVLGTTTDPVYKAMEINGIGASVLIDTAGFDDEGTLGEQRVEKTKEAAEKTDIAVLLFSGDDFKEEKIWHQYFKEKNTPCIYVISKTDIIKDKEDIIKEVREIIGEEPVLVNVNDKASLNVLKETLIKKLPEDFEAESITSFLVKEEDIVMLVMPQDIQAPKGRLILPQVQTIRDLLENRCVVISVTEREIDRALLSLKNPPALIITDSQIFKNVYMKKPKESLLTSFSVLFAAYKGDIKYYVESVKKVDELTPKSNVLIAECCTHAPMSEDIGRVKIPRLLRSKIGESLSIDVVSGNDFPKDLTRYDLIIQCGGCMFNRKYVMSRIDRAKNQNVPMTNYGILLAYLNKILDKINY